MNGIDVIQIAQAHIGERYVLGSRAPLTNHSYKGPWDCAEFTSWCAYQAYGIVFGCYGSNPSTADPYSGKWYEDAKAKETLVLVDLALGTPGAFLVRKPGDFGIGIGHVAISLGDGRTIEAHSKNKGVITIDSSSRPWTSGVHLPGVLYNGSPITHTQSTQIIKLRNPYMRGPSILRLQNALESRGHSVGTLDGIFGTLTASAVSNFQVENGLVIDGEVGPETSAALGLAWPIV